MTEQKQLPPGPTDAIIKPPDEGAYLTDGKRLAQVLGLTKDAKFVLEDAAFEPGDPKGRLLVTSKELLTSWKTVAKWEAEHAAGLC